MLKPTAPVRPLRPRIVPTPEQLQAAWQSRRRSNWPDSFDDAMADPLLGALVRMEAVRLILLAQRVARRAAIGNTSWTRSRPVAAPLAATTTDRKRLAAGDTDDD